MISKYLVVSLFFLFILLSGWWLTRTGKPYSTLILTLHKLIGLATGITLIRTVYQVHQLAALSPQATSAVVVTLLLFVIMVATGGLLSAAKTLPPVVNLLHKILPYLTAISAGVMLSLLV